MEDLTRDLVWTYQHYFEDFREGTCRFGQHCIYLQSKVEQYQKSLNSKINPKTGGPYSDSTLRSYRTHLKQFERSLKVVLIVRRAFWREMKHKEKVVSIFPYQAEKERADFLQRVMEWSYDDE